MENKKRNSFSGSIGFVLAAAGSAVGLGNIWRFPYLAAKDGGGLFLFLYLALAVTFGFTLLLAEIAMGRITKQSCLTAFGAINKKWKHFGVIPWLVSVIITPYYCVIGGWVIKYFVVFLTGGSVEAASDGYFNQFISGTAEPIVYMLIFLISVVVVVLGGVNKGIERTSSVLMPILILIIIGISVFALTLNYTDNGVTRTGIEGFKIYVIPNFEGITIGKFFVVLMDALGQLFFSLSVSMGIMITFGSYMKDDVNMIKSINHIEVFDTLVAFLAGVMVIPAVYVFMGREAMAASGPSLMFETFPKVFLAMGPTGRIIGCAFFAMVYFAALTSEISMMEAVVASLMDKFRITRVKATMIETVVAIVVAVVVCFGYNILSFVKVILPTGAEANILDMLDYFSNNCLMPIAAIGTCILIGWVAKPYIVEKDVTKAGGKFRRKGLFIVMVKYIAPAFLVILLLRSVGIISF